MGKRKKLSLFIFSVLLFPIVMFFYSSTNQIIAQENNIDSSDYQSWEEASLSKAVTLVGEFLNEQKTQENGKRPYINNSAWTEGSLMALDQVHEAAINLNPNTSEVGKELIREQLVQTVQKLQIKITEEVDGYQLSLNNYPDESLSYLLESKVLSEPSTEPEKFDIIFVLDWSGSMDYKVANITNPRLHAKEAIETLSKKLIEEAPDTRVRLMGLNAVNQNNNDITGAGLNVQIDTDFFSIENDYQTIINQAFSVSPKYAADNIPFAVKYAKEQMESGVREGATPVMIVLSDFQLIGPIHDNRPNYTKFVSEYYESNAIKSKTKVRPIYLAATYETISNRSYPMIAETIDLHRDERWDNRFFGSNSGITSPQASAEIAAMVNGIRASKKWTWYQSIDSNFTYQTNSFQSNPDVVPITSDHEVSFTGETVATALYEVNGSGDFSNYKKGDLLNSFTDSQLNYDSTGVGKISVEPQLFAPVTDAAVNLHLYKGAGEKSDPNNYSLVKTVVSSTYQSFSGKNYLDKSDLLASHKYNTKLSLAEAKDSVKSILDSATYNNLNFDTGIANAESITMQFDSSKNVYDLYAEGQLALVTVGFVDQNNQPIFGADTITIEKQIGDTVDLTINQQVKNQLSRLESEGYDLVTRPANEGSIIVEAGGTVINYVFEKAKSSIIVKFIDASGNGIKEAIELPDREVGTFVDLTAEATIGSVVDQIQSEGYRLTSTPSNEKKVPVVREKTTVEYMFERIAASLTIRFVDEGGEDFEFASAIELEQKIGDQVDLTENLEIQDQIAAILAADYDLVKRPDNENQVEVVGGGTVVVYEFTGKLIFVSAPKFIQFGTYKYSTLTTRVNDPATDQDLIVKDTRKINTKWQVSAKMISEMTSSDGSVQLLGAVRYIYNGNELILSNHASSIMEHTSKDNSPFNISDTWSSSETGDGLKLEVSGGAVKKLGKYTGEILWQLEATP